MSQGRTVPENAMTSQDGTTWMWAADAPEEDDTWKFTENGEGFSFLA